MREDYASGEADSKDIHTHTHTHTHTPEVVYGICCPGFLHYNCQIVNPANQISINLVKLKHNLDLRFLLIPGKGTFNVLNDQ